MTLIMTPTITLIMTLTMTPTITLIMTLTMTPTRSNVNVNETFPKNKNCLSL